MDLYGPPIKIETFRDLLINFDQYHNHVHILNQYHNLNQHHNLVHQYHNLNHN